MLRSSLKIGIKEIRSKFLNELKCCKQATNVRFYKIFPSHACKQLYGSRFTNTVKSFKCNSTQAAVGSQNEINQQSYFQELLHGYKNQAHRSVLIEVKEKEDIPYAAAHCEKFGPVKNAYSYPGEKENYFLLLEFSNETAADTLLKNCRCKMKPDTIPVSSRLLKYKRSSDACLSEVRINEENIPRSSLKQGASISEIIEDIYSTEKLTDFDMRLRFFFCELVKETVSSIFPRCEVVPFGSSINGVGRHGCDLDAVLILDTKRVNDDSGLYFKNRTFYGKHKLYQQKIMGCLFEMLRTFLPGISFIEKVICARVPIAKIHHKSLKLECDVSIDNVSALHVSNIIYFCGEIDDRVRPLIYSIKKWAKEAKVTYPGPGSWISNFGLTNLIIYFLQSRPNPILPPFNDALVIMGDIDNSDLEIKYLKSIEEWKKCASLNKESTAELLKEFLLFLATEPFQESVICLMSGKRRSRPKEQCLPMYIPYPFDEGLNITKNVSASEFDEMQEKAKISAECLENNMKQTENHVTDFCTLLGIPSLFTEETSSEKIDKRSSL